MKKFFLVLALAASVSVKAQTPAAESNIFIYDMGELYYNTANYDQQDKKETEWFNKYNKVVAKYNKADKYGTTLSGYPISYKGKDAGIVFEKITKQEDYNKAKNFLVVFNGQPKLFVEIEAVTNSKDNKANVKVKYTDVATGKATDKTFTEKYFIADNYFMKLMNQLGDEGALAYATQQDTGIKYAKVDDYDQSRKLFMQLLTETPVGDIFRYQYNGTAYGYTAKVFENDKYDYIVAGADKKIIVQTGYLADELKTISFTTKTDNKKHTLKFADKTYSYMGYIMEYLAKNGYLK